MIHPSPETLAEAFWDGTGLHDTFPRKIEQAIAFKLPVALVGLSLLKIAAIGQWLQQRDIATRLPDDRRDLCGCLVAFGGRGFIFTCDADAPEEQRLTLAHETAHFLIDYLLFRCAQVCHMVYNLLNLLIVSENSNVSDAYGLSVRNRISKADDTIDSVLPFIDEERVEVLLPIWVKATK